VPPAIAAEHPQRRLPEHFSASFVFGVKQGSKAKMSSAQRDEGFQRASLAHMNEFDVSKIKELQNRSLVEIIFKQLEGMILSGKIQPGERINESKLSNVLGVSRAPIREALRLLASSGILEIRTNRGMFVRDLQIKEVEELYDIRAALDVLAGERAAECINKQHLQVLNHWLEEMEVCIEKKDADAYYRANIAFHAALVEISGNANLLSMYEGVCKQMSLFRRISLSRPGQLRLSLQRHRKIVEAVKSKNRVKAANVMRNHTLKAKKALLRAIKDKKTSF
jgi:DNA-binding GntR family transcriptional regulator